MYNEHGGDLDAIERKYGIPKNRIIDFSGNINPMGAPLTVKENIINNIDLLCTYPDRSYLRLRQAIADYTGLDSEEIVVGNGSTELISLFINMIKPKKAVVIAPAYSEYQKTLRVVGSDILLFPLNEKEEFQLNIRKLLAILDNSIDMLITCNPNNPTGTAVGKQELAQIFSHCQDKGIYIMVDETYAEFADEDVYSIPLLKEYTNVFTIRGTSKFFAVPGLRLGYGCCGNRKLLEQINEKKEPWSVNVLSAIGGEAMFYDKDYILKARALITEQRSFMLQNLENMQNIHPYKSQSNFILAKLLNTKIDSCALKNALLKEYILIRDATSFDFLNGSFIRFCILYPEQNKFLLERLEELIQTSI